MSSQEAPAAAPLPALRFIPFRRADLRRKLARLGLARDEGGHWCLFEQPAAQ